VPSLLSLHSNDGMARWSFVKQNEIGFWIKPKIYIFNYNYLYILVILQNSKAVELRFLVSNKFEAAQKLGFLLVSKLKFRGD